MPYGYRKLSSEERNEVVCDRRARGYPLHSPPHPFREEGTYLITAANYEHQPIMDSPGRRSLFEAHMLQCLKAVFAEPIAWVVLPNHYHVLLNVASLDQVSAGLKQLHGSTSHDWNIEDHLTGQRRVWYKFEDRVIRNETHLQYAFNYIHYNPVKHGYVQDPQEWIWSSMSIYYEDMGEAWMDEQYRTFKPPTDFGRGWDD